MGALIEGTRWQPCRYHGFVPLFSLMSIEPRLGGKHCKRKEPVLLKIKIQIPGSLRKQSTEILWSLKEMLSLTMESNPRTKNWQLKRNIWGTKIEQSSRSVEETQRKQASKPHMGEQRAFVLLGMLQYFSEPRRCQRLAAFVLSEMAALGAAWIVEQREQIGLLLIPAHWKLLWEESNAAGKPPMGPRKKDEPCRSLPESFTVFPSYCYPVIVECLHCSLPSLRLQRLSWIFHDCQAQEGHVPKRL